MARVLSLAGAALPTTLIPSTFHNPHGHWEPMEVQEFNDRVLGALDSRWNDPFGPRRNRKGKLPLRRYTPEAREIIRRNWADNTFIVFKEPRLAVLMDLWRDALTQEGYRLSFIIMVRHPMEVADSLKTRDGMNRNASLILWGTQMLASEVATRNERRIFVRFADLLENSEVVLDRVESELDVTLPRRTWLSAQEIDAFLRIEDRHHLHVSDVGLKGVQPIARFYSFLEDAAQGAIWNEDVSKELADWLGNLEQLVAPVITQLTSELANARAAHDAHRLELEAAVAQAHAAHDAHRLELEAAVTQAHAAHDAHRLELEAEITSAQAAHDAERIELEAALQAARVRGTALQSRLDDAEREVSDALASAQSMSAEMESLRKSSEADTQTARERLARREGALTDELAAMAARVRSADDRVMQSEEALNSSTEKSKSLAQDLVAASAGPTPGESALQRDLSIAAETAASAKQRSGDLETELQALRVQSAQLARALADEMTNSQRVGRLSIADLQWRVIKRLFPRAWRRAPKARVY